MRDHRLSAFLILLIFSVSLSQGRSQKTKATDRRATGLVPYPRIGRNSELTNFPRSDRAAGLVHYPRVGRSEMLPPNVRLNRFYEAEFDGDPESYNGHELDWNSSPDQDYEGYLGRAAAASARCADRFVQDSPWLPPNRVDPIRDYRIAEKAETRPPNLDVQGPRSNQGQLAINGYTPRLGRESDHEAILSFL